MKANLRIWVLAIAELVALGVFLYCASIARDLFLEIFAIEFNVPRETSQRFVEWRTYAREVGVAMIFLWIVAIVTALRRAFNSESSLPEILSTNPPLVFALGLPIAGVFIGLVLGLFYPGF